MMKKYQTDPDKRFLPDYAKVSDYGRIPCVLAIREGYIRNPDVEKLKGLEHVPIFRTRMPPSIHGNYVKLKAFLLSLFNGKKILVEDMQREYTAKRKNFHGWLESENISMIRFKIKASKG